MLLSLSINLLKMCISKGLIAKMEFIVNLEETQFFYFLQVNFAYFLSVLPCSCIEYDGKCAFVPRYFSLDI